MTLQAEMVHAATEKLDASQGEIYWNETNLYCVITGAVILGIVLVGMFCSEVRKEVFNYLVFFLPAMACLSGGFALVSLIANSNLFTTTFFYDFTKGLKDAWHDIASDEFKDTHFRMFNDEVHAFSIDPSGHPGILFWFGILAALCFVGFIALVIFAFTCNRPDP